MFNLPERVVDSVDLQYAVTDASHGFTLLAAVMDSSGTTSIPNSDPLNAKIGTDESRVVPESATTAVKASPHVKFEKSL